MVDVNKSSQYNVATNTAVSFIVQAINNGYICSQTHSIVQPGNSNLREGSIRLISSWVACFCKKVNHLSISKGADLKEVNCTEPSS
jgi:hypothetical protein